MTDSGTGYLLLADWRRQLAALYVDVRRLASTDPVAAHSEWRRCREQLYREHSQSPLPLTARAGYQARHFPYDPALRFSLPLLPEANGDDQMANEAAVPLSVGGTAAFHRAGRVVVPFPDGERQLVLLWLPDYAGGLFLAFRDVTNGKQTYGGGRYLLDSAKSADLGGDPLQGTLVLDFNFAYQPSCAFDPQWSCPLTPPENRLDLAVRAGERLI